MPTKMDIQVMREEQQRKQQAAEEEKMKISLSRQIRILNQEKSVYAHKTSVFLNKLQTTLDFLRHERPIEIDNYLATKSETVEAKYKYDESIVKGLVRTTGIVRDLLEDEKQVNKKLSIQIDKVKSETFDTRKDTMENVLQRSKFRIPSEDKMDRRVEHANVRYHEQLQRNLQLQAKIDNALITRSIFIKDESKLQKTIQVLQDKLVQVMHEADHYYEERDRIASTKLKLQEHVTKVKESCVRELQELTSGLIEDREIEKFMMVKQKDKGGYIREKRAKDKIRVKEMLKQRDEHTVVFERLKKEIGQDDMQEIILDFIQREEDNFATFLNIADLMDDNEMLRCCIRDVSKNNVDMEMMDIEMTSSQDEAIKSVKNNIAIMKNKKIEYNKRMEENRSTLAAFYEHTKTLIRLLKLDPSKIKNYSDGIMTVQNILSILTSIEDKMATDLQDYTMVELATRATSYNKSQLSADEQMLMRQPSLHIKPIVPPKFSPMPMGKASAEAEVVRTDNKPMTFKEVKDYIIATRASRNSDKSQTSNPKSTKH